MRWSTGAAAGAALLLTAACGGSSGAADVAVRDSAGIEIVEVAGLPTEPVGWRLSPEPRVVIGGDAADERSELYRVSGAARRSDGKIVVANGGTMELRLFEADGTPAGSFGRSGGGPGEFGMLALVGLLPGDSALVHDARNRRFTVVTPEMTLGRSFEAVRGNSPAVAFPVALFPGGPVAVRTATGFGGPPTTGVYDGAAPVHLAGLDGWLRDSLAVFPMRQSYLRIGEGSINILSVPFGTEASFTAAGDRLHVGTGERYEVRSFDRDGELVRILRAAATPRPVRDEDVRAHIDRALERLPEQARPGQRRLFEEITPPERMPAYGGLVADSDANLWVERYAPPGEGPATWTVFDPAGRPLGTITTAEDMDVLEIGEYYLLGTGTDELDRPYVGMWGLER
ncbi:MAG: hypothetical protein KY466_15995 [Gemmatimonadetes bacterium]|nr:hypothetical protein [Gemmatimonadota bacterium]